jgi:hypothetical protein
MKKFLGIVVLGLMFFSPSNVKAGFIGSGEIKLSPTAVQAFIDYIKMKDIPRLFLVPIDGSSAFTWRCPHGITCVAGGYTQEIAKCERYFKKDCALFAKFRTVKWNNGINKGKKESKFSSKMSGTEIKAKLTALGFLGKTTSTTTKVEKKKETGNIFPTNAGKTTFKKKTMEDLVYLNNKKRTKEIKEHWNKKYPEYNGYKAWAESPNRAWSWRTSSISEKDAITQAVDRCNTYEADYNDPPLCVVTKVGDKHLTYQEQADWMQKIYGRTTLAAKLIGKKKIEKKKKKKKTEKTKTTSASLTEELKELNTLYKDGVLTKEEFEKSKKKLLD